MNKQNIVVVLLVLVLIVLVSVWPNYGLSNFSNGVASLNLIDEKPRPAPEFAAGIWINSEPLKLQDLRGRVVLIDFWTFGCYNCRNTLPSLKRWHEAYKEKGLTIVGVHSPEFETEKNLENVRRNVASLGIKYPVVTDNDYATWKAYGVNAWPTLFLLDKAGRIRWLHVGEGAYEETENTIRALLAEGVSSSKQENEMTDKVEKSDEQWRQELTADQFRVLRQAGTEQAFTGAYWNNHDKGTYHCAACGLPLFSSETKFDSGTGWPSFYAPIAKTSVIEETDGSVGMVRTEVRCRRCDSHLGHVFADGPQPTRLRYCLNSIALKLEQD